MLMFRAAQLALDVLEFLCIWQSRPIKYQVLFAKETGYSLKASSLAGGFRNRVSGVVYIPRNVLIVARG